MTRDVIGDQHRGGRRADVLLAEVERLTGSRIQPDPSEDVAERGRRDERQRDDPGGDRRGWTRPPSAPDRPRRYPSAGSGAAVPGLVPASFRSMGIHPPESFGRVHHLPTERLAAVMDGLRRRRLVDADGRSTGAGARPSGASKPSPTSSPPPRTTPSPPPNSTS